MRNIQLMSHANTTGGSRLNDHSQVVPCSWRSPGPFELAHDNHGDRTTELHHAAGLNPSRSRNALLQWPRSATSTKFAVAGFTQPPRLWILSRIGGTKPSVSTWDSSIENVE